MKYKKLVESILKELNEEMWDDGGKYKSGDLDLSNKDLETLSGEAPEVVKGDFDCSHNKLKSLNGAPRIVEGDFICHDNPGSDGKGFTAKDVKAVSRVKGIIKNLFDPKK